MFTTEHTDYAFFWETSFRFWPICDIRAATFDYSAPGRLDLHPHRLITFSPCRRLKAGTQIAGQRGNEHENPKNSENPCGSRCAHRECGVDTAEGSLYRPWLDGRSSR